MEIRVATRDDLNDIVEMLLDDKLGSQRESFQTSASSKYETAFELITNDPMQELVVVEAADSTLIGTLQLSLIQYLTYQGGLRGQIEAVRVRKGYRQSGIGTKLIKWAINRAKSKGAHLVQLTTDKQRPDAVAFYESLGFQSTHEGMKLHF